MTSWGTCGNGELSGREPTALYSRVADAAAAAAAAAADDDDRCYASLVLKTRQGKRTIKPMCPR